jgi:hypothetical protein
MERCGLNQTHLQTPQVMNLLFLLVCSLVLAAAWWLLVITPPIRTRRQSARVGGSALCLAVITVLYVVKLAEFGFYYFSR